MNMPDNDMRFQDIETKIAFQERLLDQLNEALTNQQQQLDTIRRKLDHISQLMESPQEQTQRPEEDSPPPHY